MKFGGYFIDRPRFAAVISILIVIAGTLSFLRLPVALYPEIAPPTIAVRASYPGASPEVIADTVSTVIEQEINGVENMLYMSSQATSDGQMQLTITFKLGTDLDTAQVQVQNRIAVAEPRLPEEVRRLGRGCANLVADFFQNRGCALRGEHARDHDVGFSNADVPRGVNRLEN